MDDATLQLEKTLKELPNCGLDLTNEQYGALRISDPNSTEVKAWLKRNGLDNQSRSNPNIIWEREAPHARITVNGTQKLMRVDVEDFGTIFVADRPVEPQQHEATGTEGKKGRWLSRWLR